MTPRSQHALLRDFSNAFNAGLITLVVTIDYDPATPGWMNAPLTGDVADWHPPGTPRYTIEARNREPGGPAYIMRSMSPQQFGHAWTIADADAALVVIRGRLTASEPPGDASACATHQHWIDRMLDIRARLSVTETP